MAIWLPREKKVKGGPSSARPVQDICRRESVISIIVTFASRTIRGSVAISIPIATFPVAGALTALSFHARAAPHRVPGDLHHGRAAPRRAQDDPRRARDDPRRVRDDPRRVRDDPRRVRDDPRRVRTISTTLGTIPRYVGAVPPAFRADRGRNHAQETRSSRSGLRSNRSRSGPRS